MGTPDPASRRLAVIVRELRETRNLSITETAQAARIDGAILSRIEAGTKMPSFQTLCRLADALNLSLDDLGQRLGYREKRPSRRINLEKAVIGAVRRHLNRAIGALADIET